MSGFGKLGELVFDGSHSRAVLFDARRPALIVTFDHYRSGKTGFPACRRSRLFTRFGFANLRLQTARNDWFVNPDLPALEALLPTLTRGYQRVVVLGYSLGGYAALRLSRALSPDQVLLISPQASLSEPFERRFRQEAAGFDARLGDLAQVADDTLRGVLIYDPFHRQDRLHARRICGLFPGIALAPCGFGGHPAVSALVEAGQRDRIRAAALDPDLSASALVGFHRRFRRRSASYWKRLAWATRRRWPALADAAQAEARLLIALKTDEGLIRRRARARLQRRHRRQRRAEARANSSVGP